ncbi:hypothetical protein [Falsirhodobacter sp. 20TX0035]|uniref:hypothetical protein n=1 Tax=Falsirhodobacter sp. 20TX0035 TaxID=3022019 RepID=UPI00232B7C76|nr:hypothetical protein [Falsirhodobacter sp. 20TX0035]MDB6454752.1 hypothetical protein [Falsirhodobacter sp. 20TX0035]
MGELRPIMKPADIRRAVSEWAAQGLRVQVKPDGTITVEPAAMPQTGDAFDAVDFTR